MSTYKEYDVLTGETETHSVDDNICHNCGSVTENSPLSEKSEVTPGMCLCTPCRKEYESAKRQGNVDIKYGPNSDTVVNVNIRGVGKSDTEPVNYNKKVCPICGSRAAGDVQLLGKVVCHSCFTDARNGKVDEYREILTEKFGENNVRDEDSDDESEHTPAAEETKRPEDYREWNLEQWKSAYVDGEINLIALEAGVEHVLKQQIEFGGPDGSRFEKSVEIATELSDSPAKELV